MFSFISMVTAAVCLGELSKATNKICSSPIISAGISEGSTSCGDTLTCFADCVDDAGLVTSGHMQACFLGSRNGPISVAEPDNCTKNAATLAYNLAQNYSRSNINVERARYLMVLEISNANAGRRRLQAGATSASLMAHWSGKLELLHHVGSATLDIAYHHMTARNENGTFDRLIRSLPVEHPHSDTTLLPPSPHRSLQSTADQELAAELAEAYINLAIASTIALIADGHFSTIYGWMVVVSILVMLPALLALAGLGSLPPRCCETPTHVERMHKSALRCACHCGWLFGLSLLLFAALSMAKFQILLTYLTERQNAIPLVWDLGDGVTAVTVPCIFGMLAGVLPVGFAMLLSRARAERRDAMAADVAIKRYKRDASKELTAPRPVLRGDPPNPAMLNPVMESGYTVNYPGLPPIGRIDSV